MGKFDKFEKNLNMDELQDEINEALENGGTGDFPEIEKGEYTVKLENLEVGECGPNAKVPGAPLLKADFKIIEGDNKNSHLFVNKALYTERADEKWNMAKLMANVIGWLESLEPSEEVGDIVFENYEQFSELILDIGEDVSELEYLVEYNKDAFNAVSIKEIYD